MPFLFKKIMGWILAIYLQFFIYLQFMQRSKLKVIAEREAEEGEAMYGKDITKEMKNVVDKFIMEPSFVPIKDLIVGRVSYGGMNPEVERYMEDPESKHLEREQARKMDTDVTDAEMAKNYKSNLANTMGKKFANKVSKRQLKKRKFLKPED